MSSEAAREADTLAGDDFATDADQVDAREAFLRLPQDIIDQICSPSNLPDSADLARLRVVSRGTRDAVAATGRWVEKTHPV